MRSFCACIAGFLFLSLPLLAGEATPNTLTDKEKEEGFVLLFNGEDLTGWTGDTKKYVVKEGVITCRGSNLFTEKEYDNFVLRFEFRLPPGGNNGIGIRDPLKGNAAYEGMEIQVLDDRHPMYKDLHDYQVHGSIYGVLAAKRDLTKPVGEWNEEEIVADGTKIKVIVNGKTALEADLAELKPIDGQKHPGLNKTKGHIGFLGHGDPVEFRSIRIKELKK